MTKHHIRPHSRGGKTNDENIVLKNDKQHKAYHLLFKNALPEEAVMIILKEWFYKDPHKKEQAYYRLLGWLQQECRNYIEKQREAGFKAGAGL